MAILGPDWERNLGLEELLNSAERYDVRNSGRRGGRTRVIQGRNWYVMKTGISEGRVAN
jgi:hypothetical protein